MRAASFSAMSMALAGGPYERARPILLVFARDSGGASRPRTCFSAMPVALPAHADG
ncbi:hypothetical protein [uncultured Parolsenella sp.]|uniref:hypothetical protein n=1 Tax=uncultured Parolsenella sp. TaxID=2083008 RepID=UPI0025E0C611|nr:hypothetical protein [uncultured Parolsenella sp.]